MLKNSPFTREDVSTLIKLLEDAEKTKIVCQQELSGIWLHDERWDTELRLLVIRGVQLTLSRVNLQNKRQGTMTKIASFMEDFCSRSGIHQICVQSVLTEEMSAWCRKNRYEPNQYASQEINGLVVGDYIKRLGKE